MRRTPPPPPPPSHAKMHAYSQTLVNRVRCKEEKKCPEERRRAKDGGGVASRVRSEKASKREETNEDTHTKTQRGRERDASAACVVISVLCKCVMRFSTVRACGSTRAPTTRKRSLPSPQRHAHTPIGIHGHTYPRKYTHMPVRRGVKREGRHRG